MKTTTTILALTAAALCLLVATEARAQFAYEPPGALESGGSGRVDYDVYVPGMRYPIENAPSYANSQVYGHGGSQGPGGGQCDANNFSYPWHDNYCEARSWTMPLCPSGTGHQGQDIRAATCENLVHPTSAAEAGSITSIGTYSVNLMTPAGTRHRYLHMDPGTLQVAEGNTVSRAQRLGYVSNAFGGTPTTVHLHYDIQQNVSGLGTVYVPTYMSLVTSYEELLGLPGQTCEALGPDGGVIDNASRCFRLHGPPASWRTVTDAGHDGTLHWTYAWNDPEPGNWAEWLIELEQAGEYEVEVYTVPEYAMSPIASWSVTAAGTRHDVRLDHVGRSGWISLGTFQFAAGDGQNVATYDNTGEELAEQKKLIADAIRLTRVEPPQPDPEPDTMMPADTGAPDDTGAPPTDTSTPPTDTSAPPTDTTPPPTDTGTLGDMVPTSGDTSAPPTDTSTTADTSTSPDGGPADNLQPLDDGCCTTVRASRDAGLPRGLGLALGLALGGMLAWRRRRRRQA